MIIKNLIHILLSYEKIFLLNWINIFSTHYSGIMRE
jgi:hypothetical protein